MTAISSYFIHLMTSYYIFWCSCFCCPFVADFLAIIFFPIKCSIDFLKQLNFASVIIWFMNRNILRELNLENLKKSSVSAPQIISLIYMNGSVSQLVTVCLLHISYLQWQCNKVLTTHNDTLTCFGAIMVKSVHHAQTCLHLQTNTNIFYLLRCHAKLGT